MRTKIISAFPGTGKTTYHSKHSQSSLDSDSSNFSWIKYENGNNTNQRNPEFPANYIEHIKQNIGKYEFIFVSSHKEVREALLDNSIFFYLVYPKIDRKDEFISRFKERGSSEGFINLLDSKWEEWVQEIYWDNSLGFQKVTMVLPNLEDTINHLQRSEF